jgi:hypothetical protein
MTAYGGAILHCHFGGHNSNSSMATQTFPWPEPEHPLTYLLTHEVCPDDWSRVARYWSRPPPTNPVFIHDDPFQVAPAAPLKRKRPVVEDDDNEDDQDDNTEDDDEDKSSDGKSSDDDRGRSSSSTRVPRRRRLYYFYGANRPICVNCKNVLRLTWLGSSQLTTWKLRRRVWNAMQVAGVKFWMVGSGGPRGRGPNIKHDPNNECAACGPSAPQWNQDCTADLFRLVAEQSLKPN